LGRDKKLSAETCFSPQAINHAMLINHIFSGNIFAVQGSKI